LIAVLTFPEGGIAMSSATTAPPPRTHSRSQRFPSSGPPSKPRGEAQTPRRFKPREKTAKKEHEILFQKFFKSVGPRTYAAQVKRASNGNHYLVLLEGKRDDSTGEVRKTRLFIYSEDFVEFFRLLKSAGEFIKANPLPEDARRKRDAYWKDPKRAAAAAGGSTPSFARAADATRVAAR
jgi:hypothetical protein